MRNPARRIASLLPAGTEIVAALGAAELLIGISHECDYPSSITGLPRLTTSPIDTAESSAAIDARVHRLHADGLPVIAVDGIALQAVRADLILTQGLCEVCAVVEGDIRSLARTISPVPQVLPLTARTLPAIFADIETVGAAIGREREAGDLVTRLKDRLHRLHRRQPRSRKRVVMVEWLEPLYLAGHWVPEMVQAAGGENAGASPGDHSRARSWAELAALEPDLIVVALCGFDLERAAMEWSRFRVSPSIEAGYARRLDLPVWAMDGNAYTSRPGPRTVDGARLIQQVLLGKEGAEVIRLR